MKLAELKGSAKKHIDGLAKATPFKEKAKRMKAGKAKRTDDYLEKRVRYIEAQRSNR